MNNVVLSHTVRDTHRAVTEHIVAALAQGVATSIMPWHSGSTHLGRPRNALTNRPYTGINVLALWVIAQEKSYPSLYFASYRQWQQLGAQVRRGERGSAILFYKKLEQEDVDGDAETDPPRYFLRASTVFNAAQVEGWLPPEPARTSGVARIARVERLVVSSGARVREGRYDIACYDAAVDVIDMPHRKHFTGTPTSNPTESFYAVLLHELTHWTGHKDRLARDMKRRFGDVGYAIEELVAELGAAFLCADLGLTSEPRPDHAAYIADWLRALKAQPNALTIAAGRASAAAEYLLSFEPKT